MNSNVNIWAIVPAAGVGARMQASMPKQYLPLLGRPVIAHTLERLCRHPRVRGVVVGLSPNDGYWRQLGPPASERFLGTFEGGPTRVHTVLNGLGALAAHAGDGDWVMVHDAVRPCVRRADLNRLIDAALASEDGALLATPLADTVKRADRDGGVNETVARSGLWRALTPQMFLVGRLREALCAVLGDAAEITDDSAAMERLGARPRLVEGHADNIKITHPGDLALAELFLKQQGDGE